MITYTYQILEIRKKDEANFPNTIKSFKIRITGTKDGQSYSVDRNLILPLPEQTSFVQYDSLTEQNVIDWHNDGIREEMASYEIQEKFKLNEGTETTSFPWL